MERSERKSGDKVLAYKISQTCEGKSCGKPSSYYLEQEYLCTACFKKAVAKLEAKGNPVIFPSYQEPQFGHIKSNMLILINIGSKGGNRNWGSKLAARKARKKSGKSRRRKNYGKLDTL